VRGRNNFEFSEEVFEKYRQKSGSKAMAKLEALRAIEFLTLYENFSAKHNILEIGGGIGTITNLLLLCTQSTIYVQESSEFCQSELKKLQLGFPSRVKISSGIENQSYGFIIIDGPYNIKELEIALKSSKELKIILFEGGRVKSRIEVLHQINKLKFRVQYLEVRNSKYKSVAGIFFLGKYREQKRSESLLDFLVIYLRLKLKYVRLAAITSKAKHVGSWQEDENGIRPS